MKSLLSTAALVAATLCAGQALADTKPSKVQKKQTEMMAQIPRCTQSLGTVSIVDGDDPYGWTQFNLAPPQKLLKVVIQRSGCFKLLDRGAGMSAAQKERELAYGGELQRGSNVGKGQIKAADYVLVAEVAGADSDASGGAAAGAIGGLVGGRFGAAIGGVKVNRLEANTVLSLTDVRTSEVVATEEGYATKTDVGWGAGGGWGFAGAVGGGYEDTEIGRIVTQAFIASYTNLVTNMGGLEPAAQTAPKAAFRVMRPAAMHRSPAPSSSVVRQLDPGMLVYPLGAKEGMWWEIEDENGNAGWVDNTNLSPAS